ncbi:MAG: arylsulfatase [Planctomycetota bacterium]
MRYRRIRSVLAVLPLGLSLVISAKCFAAETAPSPPRRPNVLLIVTDDQGYGDLAAHGNELLQTPNLDRLRASAVTLEDFHVDPVCTPTRAALMTGRYCGRVGAWTVTHGRQLLHARERTMADYFRASGYATAMFGKWHLGDFWPYDPGSRGFDEVVCCRAGGVDEIGNPVGNDYIDDVYFRNGVAESFRGYCTDVFVNEAMRVIRRPVQSEQGQPFFVYLATNAMHSPFNVPERYARRFRELGLPENRAKFYGMIENFDENLGRLLGALDQTGQADDTIVVFLGDNGTAANSGSEGAFNAGMRGDKGSVYEGGHRVACFIRWPNGLPSPHAVSELTCHRDLLPTLIDLCGLQTLRDGDASGFDGTSIAALLRNRAVDWPDRTLVVERQETTPALTGRTSPVASAKHALPQHAVLTRRWRFVNGELYDIAQDPGQATDVAAEHPVVARRLDDHYRHYYADVYANVEDDARIIIGAPESKSVEFTVRDWRPTSGNVIWEMGQLERDDLWIHGYWPLEVATAGRYRIELARYPFESARAMGAGSASLRVGPVEHSAETQPRDSSVSFVTNLAAGRHKLSGALVDASTKRSRGPYFVRITALAD